VVAAGCARRDAAAPALHLVDLYRPDAVEARAPAVPPPPPTEWRFDGKDGAKGWEAFTGVSGLEVRGGRLAGRATDDLPLIHLELPSGTDNPDLVHEVQLRLRVSAGANVALGFDRSEKLDRAQTLDMGRNFPWDFTTPVVAGDEVRTYALKSPFSTPFSGMRHLLVRPTDQKGASFEIESVRIVFRREHLAGVASGIGWHGLSEIYKESLVARSPETVRLRLRLPARPWLDLGLGTLDDGPLRFRVTVGAPGDKAPAVLLERTLTRPHRWEPAPVDLEAIAGREVELGLSLIAERPGVVGLWGAPVVRNRGALPASAIAGPPGIARPQGVILVWADTLRRDHLGAYGYERPTSPVLDRLAAEGALFRDCVTQASWTKVSTPSLFTSLYPSSHGVKDFADRLPSSAQTLAEAYREAGYATLSLSSILFTGKFTNLHQGFDEVHEDTSLPDRRSSKTAREYVDRLIPWLEAHRDGPFFVFLHVSDPHDPYRPHAPYDALWADPAKREEHERHAQAVRPFIADPLLRLFGMPARDELVKAKIDPEAYVAYERAWYDGSIREMDTELGRLVERLTSLGLAEKTLVAFTADHGEEFFEHGRMFHGQTVYGEQNNAPLFLWGPGIVPKGVAVAETVRTIDVMPTLLEASRLRPTPGAQGRSLWPLVMAGRAGSGIARAAREAPPSISEKAATTFPVGAPPPRDTESTAIVAGGFKLVHHTKRSAGRPEWELFDRGKDVFDQVDVAPAHAKVVERLARELKAWRQAAEAGRLAPDAEGAQALSKEELERLRSLGYIQ
jgi:arylsulfatase A-like enzyme